MTITMEDLRDFVEMTASLPADAEVVVATDGSGLINIDSLQFSENEEGTTVTVVV